MGKRLRALDVRFAERPRRLGRGLRHQPFLSSLAGGTLLYAVAWAAFNNRPEWFARGGEFGALGNDLCVGYLAAWIFNVLVVVMPNEREREGLRLLWEQLTDTLARPGMWFRNEILRDHSAVDLNIDFHTRVSIEQARTWAEAVSWQGSTPVLRSFNGGVHVYWTWQDYLSGIVVSDSDRAHAAIAPHFPKLPSDILIAVEKVASSTFVVGARGRQGMPLIGGNMGSQAKPLKDYIDACQDLRELVREV